MGEGELERLTPLTVGMGVLAGLCRPSKCIEGKRERTEALGETGVRGTRLLPGKVVGTDGNSGNPEEAE